MYEVVSLQLSRSDDVSRCVLYVWYDLKRDIPGETEIRSKLIKLRMGTGWSTEERMSCPAEWYTNTT